MDYDLSHDQKSLIAMIDKAIEEGSPRPASEGAIATAVYDALLDERLERTVDLEGAGLLDRVLVAEHLAEHGTATTFGLRAVLGAVGAFPGGGLLFYDAERQGPVRYAGYVRTGIVLQQQRVLVAAVAARPIRQSQAGFGYPYAHISTEEISGEERDADPAQWRRLFRLALAAEIAGNAAAAISRTADHLVTRKQFGRALSTNQALRHRLADARVSAEATKWMVRDAAFKGTPESIDLAVFYAAQTAGALVPELTQLCGARSFTLAFGLHVFTMRLDGLRLELGGPDRLSAAVMPAGAVG